VIRVRLYLALALRLQRAVDWLIGLARDRTPPPVPVPVVPLDVSRLPVGAFLWMPLADVGSYAQAAREREALHLLGRAPEARA
jgi:hypothetical protein